MLRYKHPRPEFPYVHIQEYVRVWYVLKVPLYKLMGKKNIHSIGE